MPAQMTYKPQNVPMQRNDLKDYFPTVARYYPGYIKQAVFSQKLTDVAREALAHSTAASARVNSRGLELRAAPPKGPFISAAKSNVAVITAAPSNMPVITTASADPSWSTSLEVEMLRGVNKMQWRPANVMRDFSQEMWQRTRKHAFAAVAEPAFQIVGGKAVDRASKYVAKGVDALNSGGKIGAKMGKAAHVMVTTYEVKPQKFKNPIVSINITEWGMGKAIDTLKPDGYQVSLNNDETRAWMTKNITKNDTVSSVVLEMADIASDFIPVAVVVKSVESFFGNVVLSWNYWSEARKAEEACKHFDKLWSDFEKKLKTYIRQDISKLSERELMDLCKFLNISYL